MCGAVFAAWLKNYFQKHCQIDVERWYHLVYSRTILGAIQRESYGYQTFFVNRVGEIQSSTDIRSCWWIPGPANIADIIIRGASPDDLTEESEWQSSPQFLQLPESEWPKKSVKDVGAQARDNITKIQKKTFVAVLTRSQHKAQDPVRIQETESKSIRPPAVAAVQKLLDERRFSSLRQLVGMIAWTWRAAKKFLCAKFGGEEKWEAVPSSGVIRINEREDVFRNLFSNYKSHTTLKSMIRIAPYGPITFVSSLYARSVSDNDIFK